MVVFSERRTSPHHGRTDRQPSGNHFFSLGSLVIFGFMRAISGGQFLTFCIFCPSGRRASRRKRASKTFPEIITIRIAFPIWGAAIATPSAFWAKAFFFFAINFFFFLFSISFIC